MTSDCAKARHVNNKKNRITDHMNRNNSVSAFCDDALGTSDAVELASRIARREISASEAVEAAIARAGRVNPQLNAIVCEGFESARQLAAKPRSGGLAGVPTFVKDNSNLKGLPTRHGSRATNTRPAQKNGVYVEQMLSTGLIALGKTTLPEFGVPPVTESVLTGITRNPWHTNHTPGGSSGGSAALVAAGVVPIAHANDGGGSIRIPASCCGLVGLKASRHRLIHMDGTDGLPINVVHDGVVTRSVRDTALFMAEAEKYYSNPKMPRLGHVTAPGKKRLRIGVVREAIAGIPIHPDVLRVLDDTAKICVSLGHQVEYFPIPFPDQLGEDFLAYYAMLSFGMTRLGRIFIGPNFQAKDVEPFTREFGGHFVKCIWRMPAVMRRLKQVNRVTAGMSERFDIVLNPTLTAPPPPVGTVIVPSRPMWDNVTAMRNYAPFTALQNISGDPAISLPMGMSQEGLPIGMHFTAGMGEDRLLLELAYELEAAKGWPSLIPSR
jgi:amidase